MRLAIAGFALESVTFLPEQTDIADFERGALRGPALVEGLAGTNTSVGGFLDVCRAEGVEPVGLVNAGAGAAASASEAAFEQYVGEIVAGLARVKTQVDGLLLHLHGALATPSRRNADAQVLQAIRAAVGPDFPIAVALDLHGNVGRDMVEAATVLAGYHHSPYTDIAPPSNLAWMWRPSTGDRPGRIGVSFGMAGVSLGSGHAECVCKQIHTRFQMLKPRPPA